MFNQTVFSDFFGTHKDTLLQVELLRQRLETRFHKVDGAIHAVLLATLSDVPCLLFGPPGVAKSRLIRSYCEMIGVIDDATPEDRRYFEYLLTPFTEPTELFGSYTLVRGADGDQSLKRVEQGMLHNCEVAFLDEVFRGSSAILNTLLALMHEGVFHDRGDVKTSKLKLLFGATNDLPRGGDLEALFDRFVLRAYMDNVDPAPGEFAALISRATQTHVPVPPEEKLPGFLENVGSLRAEYLTREQSPNPDMRLFDLDGEEGRKFLSNLSYIVKMSKDKGLGEFSNRRVFHLVRVMAMQRLMRAAREGAMGDAALSLEDYQVIWSHFLDVDRPVDGVTLNLLLAMPEAPPVGRVEAAI